MENAEVTITPETTPKRRGRPPGVKSTVKTIKKPVKKKPVKKPVINLDAVMANASLKSAKVEIESLTQDLNAAILHIDALEKRNHGLLTVIGYLESKLFKPD